MSLLLCFNQMSMHNKRYASNMFKKGSSIFQVIMAFCFHSGGAQDSWTRAGVVQKALCTAVNYSAYFCIMLAENSL